MAFGYRVVDGTVERIDGAVTGSCFLDDHILPQVPHDDRCFRLHVGSDSYMELIQFVMSAADVVHLLMYKVVEVCIVDFLFSIGQGYEVVVNRVLF